MCNKVLIIPTYRTNVFFFLYGIRFFIFFYFYHYNSASTVKYIYSKINEITGLKKKNRVTDPRYTLLISECITFLKYCVYLVYPYKYIWDVTASFF